VGRRGRLLQRAPPLEQVGVEFVADVAPFELAKKRLLNGTHCALAYLGLLAGHATTAQAMADPRLRDLTTRLMDEVVQLLPPSPGLDAIDYARTIRERLANRGMADQLTRLAARGSTKMRPTCSLARAGAAREPALRAAGHGGGRLAAVPARPRGPRHRGRAP
jgi:mannitol-1-phosphate/altronate dehydrogenase